MNWSEEDRERVAAAGQVANGARVASLERLLEDARRVNGQMSDQVASMQTLLDKTAIAAANRVLQGEVRNPSARERDELLATAFVPVEIRWELVRAGDMTLDRKAKPWMVEERWGAGMVRLRQGEKTFDKPPTEGETVRVLVPHAEAAEFVALRERGLSEVGAD